MGGVARFLIWRVEGLGIRVLIVPMGVMVVVVVIMMPGHLDMPVRMLSTHLVSVLNLNRDRSSHAIDHPNREDQEDMENAPHGLKDRFGERSAGH